ncbi:Alg9-like mannosyltransferase family-domain-containing protein [Clohesyomyces aquaticus]|uniref:Mannosyltransferase n=1 Tax=Clohesyomyces aquaticus TaxID=1231657 RepID=A0A1Y1ZPQ1_9PLEO|nr:Alg9-like mannosyltransferase family-domain-containing protein [Clohesyomyces aquaticus]
MPPRSPSDSATATITRRTGSPRRSDSFSDYRESRLGIFVLLLGLRIVNALTLRTFFQPDEYFQSLEPAWQLAFGQQSHAWITWEWRTQLRTSLHPGLFAVVYQVAAKLAHICDFGLPVQAQLFIAAPKVVQAVFAALLDCYTWKLAESTYGKGSRTAFTALALSICSPWQWFCSTRTLSNCLETTLTSIAVYYWPWQWPEPRLKSASAADARGSQTQSNKPIAGKESLGPLPRLRLSLLLAAFACILRPTNLLIWLTISFPTLWNASSRQRYILIREVFLCGSAVIGCSLLSDRFYYQVWTFPPLRFLYFNIVQSLAVFYGRNRPDYYLTEGLPLLLTTALPFAVVGFWQALFQHGQPPSISQTPTPSDDPKSAPASQSSNQQDAVSNRILSRLAWTCITLTASLTLISHKEVRFLYPILSFLHILSARPLASFFSVPIPPSRRAILTACLLINLAIAGYASQVHQRGVIDVMDYLRQKHESRLIQNESGSPSKGITTTTVGFLMPCHSTPWRSHLVYPSISAWALSCEPPLYIPLSSRSTYLDEADQFYVSPGPVPWLEAHMASLQTITASGSRSGRHWANMDPGFRKEQHGKSEWPMELVFFEALEEELRRYLKGTRYKECWRGFNSHWHDDGRRTGDVVVWCLDG